jgi:hypothetical protein
MRDFYAQGVMFDPEWNDSATAWDAMTGWPLTGRRAVCRNDYGRNFINIRDCLREALTEDVNILLYGWAQMENPSSILRTLTQNPGIYYYANGETLGRPAMHPYAPTPTAPAKNKCPWDSEEQPWWFLPHPLQIVDACGATTWSLLGAADFYAAAAGAMAGSLSARTDRVPLLTRPGILIPAGPGPEEPMIGYRCFWASLVSKRDDYWQKWPFQGLHCLPKAVTRVLDQEGWTPSSIGVYYLKGEPCYCGAFVSRGVVIPIHRLCEQADGAESLQAARYFLYLMACSAAYHVWTRPLKAGDFIPDDSDCYFVRGEGSRVPLLYNEAILKELIPVAKIRDDFFDLLPTRGNREMLRGIPLKVPIEKATKRRTTSDGKAARMINGVHGLNPGHPVSVPHYPHSLPDPVLDAQVKVTCWWPDGGEVGKWFDPKLALDDKEVYGFTNCMKKALDSGLDCARRLDRQREREREREVNQPGSRLPYESAD